MAKNPKENIPEANQEPKETAEISQKKAAENTESTYTVEEIINAHKAFNAPREIVAVALKLKGITTATEAEAKQIIEDFKKQEVR